MKNVNNEDSMVQLEEQFKSGIVEIYNSLNGKINPVFKCSNILFTKSGEYKDVLATFIHDTNVMIVNIHNILKVTDFVITSDTIALTVFVIVHELLHSNQLYEELPVGDYIDYTESATHQATLKYMYENKNELGYMCGGEIDINFLAAGIEAKYLKTPTPFVYSDELGLYSKWVKFMMAPQPVDTVGLFKKYSTINIILNDIDFEIKCNDLVNKDLNSFFNIYLTAFTGCSPGKLVMEKETDEINSQLTLKFNII